MAFDILNITEAVSKFFYSNERIKRAIGIDENTINNEFFYRQLRAVRRMKEFLLREKVKISENDLTRIDLENLNNISYHPHGRKPSSEEWKLLDEKSSFVIDYLDAPLKQKIRLWELGLFFGGLPAVFLVFAIFSVLLALSFPEAFEPAAASERNFTKYWPNYISVLLWTVSLGGLGSCAYLGTALTTKLGTEANRQNNASNENDISHFGSGEVDLTDQNFLRTRIILGILFAFLFGLPFSYESLTRITYTFASMPGDSGSTGIEKFPILLAPFLMGFSTNLVLLVMERLVISVRALFGSGTPR